MKLIDYRSALREALAEEMERDLNVFIIGEDIGFKGGSFKVTEGLLDRFGPWRIVSAPISESAIAGAGVGAALVGMRPVVEIMFIDFATLAMDMIVNQCAKFSFMSGGEAMVPVVIRTQGGAGRGIAAQHSQSLEAYFAHTPGLKVVMPSTPYDAKGLLKSAIRSNDPVFFIEHKELYLTKQEIPEDEFLIPIGKADVKRTGNDVTIIATSRMVLVALEAADALAKNGIDCEVIDPRTLVPLDEKTIIESVKKTGRAAVVHEACKSYGFGAEIAALVMEKAFDWLDKPVMRIAGLDTSIPYNATLERLCIPDAHKVIQRVKELVA